MRHARRFGWAFPLLLVGATSLVLSCPAHAAEEEKPEPLILKTYYVRDLLMSVPDHPLQTSGLSFADDPPAYPAGSPCFPGPGPEEVPVGRQEFLDILQRVVNHVPYADVAAWDEEGGPASVEFYNWLFIVIQTEKGHARIEELFKQLRKHQTEGPMFTIMARWILVDPGKAKQLTGADPKREVPCLVTDAVLDKAGAKVLFQGEITAFNGQTVHLGSGLIQTYLADVEPVVAESALAVNPTVGAVQNGAVLQVRPILTSGGKETVIDVRSEVVDLKQMRVKPFPEFGQAVHTGKPIKVDLEFPEVYFHTFRTTVRVPLDKPVLISGMTDPHAKKGEMLYLVLKVSASK